MASGSPRTRINQFYVSKKRKHISPGLKSDINEEDAKTTVEVSIGAKATLDNYLVTSPDKRYSETTSFVPPRLLSGEDDVKRSLSEQISGPVKNELTELRFQPSAAIEEKQHGKFEGISDAGSAIIGDVSNKCFVDKCAENPELKQFAADFLSLYCRGEFQANVTSALEQRGTDHKRYCSPSMPAEEVKTYKKRLVNTNQLHADSGTSSLIERAASYVPVELKGGLKKCKKATKSSATTSECQTPGSSIMKASSLQTPKSTGGVSIFSPGEAFWNEAIEVADGLYAPTVNISAPVAEDTHALQYQHDIKSCCSLENGHCDGKLKIIQDECASNTLLKEVGASAVLPGKDIREMNNDKSPIPVKHFDFSGEGKTLDKSNPHCCGSNYIKVLNHRGNDSEHDFVRDKSSPETNIEIGSSEFGTNENKVQLNPRVPGVTIRPWNVAGQLDELKYSCSNHQTDGSQTPSSFAGATDRLDLRSWLPFEICSTYKKKGITKLYPWQVECLLVDGVLKKRNLVYCASTSAGKTIVAEILMLRRVISTGKIALLVLPYVSICAEKAEYLEILLGPLNKHVRSYYANQGGGMLPKDTAVAVCTIEKANSLINKLLEEGRLSEIGIIVIDELHMVGDQNRGYLLELLLTKLLYAAGEGNSESSTGESPGSSSGKTDPANGLQIVGMSATMPNVAAVADWLQAALYHTDFRPVPLEEYIKVGNVIYCKKMDVVRTISKTADIGGKDPDHVIELCNEVVQEGHSVLIFCSSRKGCESTARHVSKFIKKFSTNVVNGNSEIVDIASAIDALRRSPAGLDPILEETLPLGVAYHHAGLTVEEREVVETCYRSGLLRVLTATSTLAAGVNLPARRVIFRQPRIGRDFIDGTRYRQMAGRAGRTGIDSKGESILICKPEEIKRINVLVNENCPPLHSCLSEDKNGMIHAILEVVAAGIVQTTNDIHRYVKCTLLNSTKPFQDVVKSAQESLRWLCHKKFLEWTEATKLYSTTPLGRAAFGSSLNPEESLVVLDDLLRAREGFVLASDLHVVYLVTPVNVEVEPNWELYYKQFMELSTLDQSVGNRVGVAEPFLMRMAHGAPMCSSKNSTSRVKWFNGKGQNQHGFISNTNLSEEESLRVCKRFYVALILSRLIQEAPVREVCEAFKVARGMVQALQETAGRFAAMVSVFCERLGWNDLEGLVVKFQNRVSFGVRAEIVELTTIPYVKGSRARALYKAGLRTPLSIAEASITDIVKALFESSSWTAQESLAKKGMQIGMAKKIKHGARKLVLEKAEEARIAAFSAFKSLGLDVHQITEPLPTSPFSIDNSSNVGGIHLMEPILAKPSVEERHRSNVVLESEEGIKKAPNVERPISEEMTIIDTRHDVRVENCQLAVENSVVFTADVDFASDANTNVSDLLGKQSDGNHINACNFDKEREEQCRNKTLYPADRDRNTVKGPINASSSPGGFDAFLDIWDMTQEFYFDIHYNKRSGMNSTTLFEIQGIAICWKDSPVYYINLPKDLLLSERQRNDHMTGNASIDKDSVSTPEHVLKILELRWNRIKEIIGKRNVLKFTWNLKVQIHVLKNPTVANQKLGCLNSAKKKGVGLELLNGLYFMLSPVYVRHGVDICIVAWMLWPDDERSSNPNLEKEVKKRLSREAAAAANRNGQWKNQMTRVSHNGCCRRVAQTRALCSVLWKLVISEELVEALMNVEVPLVNVLADMECYGIGVDMEGCLNARRLLGRKLRCLETEAYKLAGMTFSLYAAADIANVLYGHLKLCIPEGHNKGKLHPSTDKHCLDLLRHEHPIVPVIKEHRTLAKLFNCTLGSICSLARLSPMSQKYTLHGHWLQTSAATGRLSIEEPNLQCVEHMVDFKMTNDNTGGGINHYKINARDFFLPTQENWLLLTADYSQIELRLMAHFSKDSSLIDLLNRPVCDIFTMIAARWIGKPEISVGSVERNQTKGLVYGMLYGMGSKTLAEQLECSIDEAAEKIQNFKSSFPGVTSWLHQAIDSCRDKGHVKTLNGRKRFLSKIKFGNKKEKSKAQRQVVNSICQGSAADIIKIAMINLYSVIDGECDVPDYISSHATKFHMLRNQCRILLQVHDELVLEVHPSVVKEAASLLQICMENAASLLDFYQTEKCLPVRRLRTRRIALLNIEHYRFQMLWFPCYPASLWLH